MNKDFDKKCEYNNCEKFTFIVTVNNDYTYKLLSKYLDLTNQENKEILNKLCSIEVNLKQFLMCKEHLLETYGPLFKMINPDITSLEIINIFEKKANEWHCNKVYSSWFSSSDYLRKSLENISNSTEHKSFSFTDDIVCIMPNLENIENSEFRWFNLEDYYAGIPVYWKKNYSLKKYIGAGPEQGKLNGPDFIFKDNFLNKTVGFEIFELNPNLFIKKKPLKNNEHFIKMINKQINQVKGGNLSRNVINLLDQVKIKANKWAKYQETDIRAIGVIINNSIPDEWYVIMEYLINFCDEKPKEIDWVFLL